jgi:hypothetical protein
MERQFCAALSVDPVRKFAGSRSGTRAPRRGDYRVPARAVIGCLIDATGHGASSELIPARALLLCHQLANGGLVVDDQVAG